MQPEQNRFLRKVSYNSVTTCWDWLGSKYRFGYGHFRRKLNNKWVMFKAHRYSYEFYKGPIPQGAFVCHTCDNPGCVNPDHLFTGTAKENVDDMFNKGRKSRIIRNPKHNLLSFEYAQEIRAYHKRNPEVNNVTLADWFDTSTTQISRILNNKIWTKEY